MEAREYEKMAEVEDCMWWYRALHSNLRLVIGRFLSVPRARVLDAGCGTGGLLRALTPIAADRRLFGLDAWQPACTLAAARSHLPVVRALLQRLPFADGAVDCLVSADVLCHENVDPALALSEAHRCLRAGGLLVLNLPAYQWMLSYHDERVRNVRRFTRRQVLRLFDDAGFSPLYATYWNTLLFPLMALRRLLPAREGQESDVYLYPPAVEAMFRALLSGERALLRAGVRLPFGGSVLAVARRCDG
jgi:SAM-dependent methyltransferase